ncbi:MAG: hypothetical protein HWD59_00400 [Coxiellaceae bacterium]|nr:MAG: hypothetical protein HWD59_00400 [Coxiellaceae bacterium]
MRNYVAQQQLNLSEENLLMGLILGESGRYEDGWKNNRLKNKKLSSQKIQTAEGIYGRPAFKTADGQYWIAINKDSKTIKTKRKINDFINRYGYTKMQTWRNGLTRQIEPKYGFVLVPQQVIEKLNYQPAETIAQFAVSPELTNEISDNPPGLQTIGRDEMRSYAEYLNVVRNRPAELILSFNDFMRQRFF